MEILSDKTVTTRKRHICNACHRPMPIGTKMRTCFIVDGGDNWTWRECPTCAELLIDYREVFENNDNGYDDGCVREVCNGLTPEELLVNLTAERLKKQKLRDFAEAKLKKLRIPHVVGRSEQLVCDEKPFDQQHGSY